MTGEGTPKTISPVIITIKYRGEPDNVDRSPVELMTGFTKSNALAIGANRNCSAYSAKNGRVPALRLDTLCLFTRPCR
jgi:hypothetical protein